jgi:hypothetical protein
VWEPCLGAPSRRGVRRLYDRLAVAGAVSAFSRSASSPVRAGVRAGRARPSGARGRFRAGGGGRSRGGPSGRGFASHLLDMVSPWEAVWFCDRVLTLGGAGVMLTFCNAFAAS